MPVVESITQLPKKHKGRSVYLVTLSGDKDWNGEWRGIHILAPVGGVMNGYMDRAIKPGDQMWYGVGFAYWTMQGNIDPKLQDVKLERHGYDFTVGKKK